ncbi:BA75_00267T0 [Komagataella pastoris]|uniref:BA75_00267T0 n=1 Tax=Komagataella pastoris TaxID=4922 RepID=A0A1B2J5G0_PICPA|nr:BA75_00267T0 [Komagataella pastoris]
MASNSIGEDFYQSLLELTFNSHPIIHSLTTIAQENMANADQIVEAILKRINSSAPEHKLYTLYLIDSICKNVGSPYNLMFGDSLYQLFSRCYSLVADSVRQRMIHIFETWKVTRTPSGSPLFPPDQLAKIDRFLTEVAKPKPVMVTQQSLIDQLRQLQGLVGQRLHSYPNDIKAKERLQILGDLLKIITSQPMSPQELTLVNTQVQGIRKDEEFKLRSPTPAAAVPKPALSSDAMSVLGGVLQSVSMAPQYQQQQLKSPPPNILGGNVSSILSSLAESGLINNINNKHSNNLVSPINDILSSNDLSGSLAIDSGYINNHKPTLTEIDTLYRDKPNQCSSCSKRFTEDDAGRQLKSLHLDWHFRINKRIKDYSNIQSRGYYLDDSAWVKFKEIEIIGYKDSDDQTDSASNSKTTTTGGQSMSTRPAELDPAELALHYVVVPDDVTDMTTSCGICKEEMVGKFNDDSGEWVWSNATQSGDKVYHYSCFRETQQERSLHNVVEKRERSDDSVASAAKRPETNSMGSSILNIDFSKLRGLTDNLANR